MDDVQDALEALDADQLTTRLVRADEMREQRYNAERHVRTAPVGLPTVAAGLYAGRRTCTEPGSTCDWVLTETRG